METIRVLERVTGSLLIMFMFSVVGCGQGFRGQAEFAQIETKSIDDQLAKAEEAKLLAEKAIDEAHAAVSEITDENGNIKVGLFSSGSGSSSTTRSKLFFNGLIEKLRSVFDTVFARAEEVKEHFELARDKLEEAMDLLDKNDPEQAERIEQIKDKLAYIDELELEFSESMHKLSDKLGVAVSGLEKIISGVTSFIPGWGWLVNLALDYLVMNEVKDLVLDLRVKLLSL
ncbi:MAG: hypothetical protein AB7G93_03165 [Bdellovibrionales bacterium]